MTIIGLSASAITGEVLTAARLDAHNDFENPNIVAPVPFAGVRRLPGRLVADLPPRSVTMLNLQPSQRAASVGNGRAC